MGVVPILDDIEYYQMKGAVKELAKEINNRFEKLDGKVTNDIMEMAQAIIDTVEEYCENNINNFKR